MLKDDTETEKYSEYLDEYTIADLVKKYSDYIRYPITMYREKIPPEAEAGGRRRRLQARVRDLHRAGDPEQHGPHLEAPKSEVKPTRNTTSSIRASSWTTPTRCAIITSRTEGTATYTALLFVPGQHAV